MHNKYLVWLQHLLLIIITHKLLINHLYHKHS